jgi:hypothetical protein
VTQYNIWLGNPHHWEYKWQELCEEVFNLFWPVVEKHKDFKAYAFAQA